MKRYIININLLFVIVIILAFCKCETDNVDANHKRNTEAYTGKKAKNIIFMIGDGMGIAQIHAGMIANHGKLNLGKCKYIGFIKTSSADNYITDSGAGGTAFATGVKTNNGAIGVDINGQPQKTILEIAEDNGLATGLISTSAITHATPASFIAHQLSRDMYEEIAADFLETDVDVIIGGGKTHFANRSDGINLVEKFQGNGYSMYSDVKDITNKNNNKLICFTADGHNPRYSEGRGDMLPNATMAAINILKQNEKGFFLMVEGSFIDWGGHANDIDYIVEEVLDFDRAVGKALEFAAQDGNTLVIITADHECGGMTITGGNIETGEVQATFSTTNHTAVMVPVFAYGPGGETFTGVYENNIIFNKLNKAFGFSESNKY